MKWDPVSRRFFLQGLGGVSLALPFLPSLLKKVAFGAGAPPMKSFVAMRSEHGHLKFTDYFPTPNAGSETAFTPYAEPHTMHETKLTDVIAQKGAISRVMGPLFNPYAEKMNLLRGLDLPNYWGHNDGIMLGNMQRTPLATDDFEKTPTIDQVIANSEKFNPAGSFSKRSIALCPGGGSSLSFSRDPGSGNVIQVPSLSHNAQVIYDSLFPSGNNSNSGSGTPLIDAVLSDYQSLLGSNQLSQDDKSSLDSHMTYLAELQSRVSQNFGCSQVGRPENSNRKAYEVPIPETEDIYRLNIDMIVAGIRCGVCRVATLKSNSPFAHSRYSPDVWHGWAHSNPPDGNFNETMTNIFNLNRWILEKQYLYLIGQLDSISDGQGGTLLDHSSCIFGWETAMVHGNICNPIIMAGGASGALRTGNFIDYTDRSAALLPSNYTIMDYAGGVRLQPGLLYNQFLVTMLRAMGLDPADYKQPLIDKGYGHYRGQRTTHAYGTLRQIYIAKEGHLDKPLPGLVP